ncbi:unnamed protein product [Durusdinium trenchii]|uniref:Uncharacterized protein n=1 Tax=Durusdinium trenchii TaxID=1381693 RepID=A0ABP0RA20_9DINO
MAELLRTLVGSGWYPEWTRRCGAHFRELPDPMWKDAAYQEVMGLLVERGLGEVREQRHRGEVQAAFVKGCWAALSKEAKEALKEMGAVTWREESDDTSANRAKAGAGFSLRWDIGVAVATVRPEAHGSDSEENKPEQELVDPEPVQVATPEWATLFHGSAPGDVGTCASLRKTIERVLGQAKDCGVYNFHEKQLKAAQKKVKGTLTFSDKGPMLCVQHKGIHGELQAPQGGSLWTCAEALALEALETKRPRVTSKDVRAALQAHGLNLRCSTAQLHSFVIRFNGAGRPQCNKGKLTVGQLENAAGPFMSPHMDAWQSWKVWRLIVLPSSTFDEERVCVMWTCPGMLRRAQALKEKVLKLVVDAKQRVVVNEYGIVTLAFLVSSASPTKTWAGASHTKSVAVHTATQEPFLQALVSSESERNMTQIFTEACNVAEKECGLDLRAQVWQVHKDYAKGIEASRRAVFPHARPCDDYAHMRRASYKVLQQHLPSKARVSGPQTQKPKAKKGETKKATVEEATGAEVSVPAETDMVLSETDAFGRLEQIIQISRQPTAGFSAKRKPKPSQSQYQQQK